MQITTHARPAVFSTTPTPAQALIAVGKALLTIEGAPGLQIEAVEVHYFYADVPKHETRPLTTMYKLKINNNGLGQVDTLEVQLCDYYNRSKLENEDPDVERRRLTDGNIYVNFDNNPEREHAEALVTHVCELLQRLLKVRPNEVYLQIQLAHIGRHQTAS